ncbi:Biotin carboxylase of acetyl-CoA carboxylase [Patulibacter medicamentivorans]|uniref:biotin carboxylase n=1 Tax=Patulibacter medicamentivorans TaxID=1097667 RepID=H0E6W3_9ACTN|nr:acetyl-CoA carboxylase biotin carboxylase subunit [Patulibacter medicamentivorans]EHN10604.1 Biotin carboxylase of acetyl-CoA carboxylase [Patulibacter medicamentivorans]
MFGKILVANRGEIAIRVIRACEELGIKTVAVYSELDRDALHVQRADEAYLLGPAEASASYLNVDRIIEVVKESGAEAVHPGYGFLAENAPFAQRLADEGIVFIGPPASAIDAMGSKTKARELMQKAGVPIVPGTTDSVDTYEDALRIARDEIGYPVAVKAASGGGGKGFRVALTEDKLKDAYEGASREGEKFFSDGTVYLERYLPNPRHVEVQIIADTHGNVIHLGERDCSIQRRHQKLIEEAPAPPWVVDEALRQKIGEIGINAAKAVDYVGAGTIEGMLQDGEYFFLEMNTRVQVEHCVTEMVTGIDIVKQGIKAAAGLPLDYAQEDVVLRGHAIEARINAESAPMNFAPTPGAIGRYLEPSGPGVRVDSGVGAGGVVSPQYDPMVAKLIVWDEDREQATKRMLRALSEYEIEGLTTLLPFHQAIFATDNWAKASTCSELLEDKDWLKSTAPAEPVVPIDLEDDETVSHDYVVEVSGRKFDVKVHGAAFGPVASANGSAAAAPGKKAKRSERKKSAGGGADDLPSPIQGNMWKVVAKEGQEVAEGDLICIIEAMKMENEITAHKAGTITTLAAKEGEPINTGDLIATIKSAEAAE